MCDDPARARWLRDLASSVHHLPMTTWAFELRPTAVHCNGYGDVTLPERRRGRAEASGGAAREMEAR